MAVTRTRSKSKKITFSEDGLPEDGPVAVPEPEVIDVPSDSEESESDDEAPEEESTTSAKKNILEQQKKQKQIEAELRRIDREKRRQLDLQNKQQQEAKRAKTTEDLPEFLPDDIIEAAKEEPKQLQAQPQGKHLKVEDFDAELKRQLKAEKLKQLKNKAKAIKKGPVHVQVLGGLKKTVPKVESKVVGSKDKWLKRKSLHKK